jgi:hypothetical protein
MTHFSIILMLGKLHYKNDISNSMTAKALLLNRLCKKSETALT